MDNIKKFQGLLKDLFQFDAADLDFGIYRIMNKKRGVIERFIMEDLPKSIAQELSQGALAGQTQAAQELEAAKKKVLEIFDDAIDAAGNLIKYHDTKPGKEYLAALEKAKCAKGREALETAIYNHLYTFFRRYWQDGDFISKRRYSKRERYAIPYNGEEVTLYWANHDQYYIKTGEYFTDYTWKATNGVTVHFKLTAADVEQNNVKGDKRFFLPQPDEMVWDESAKILTIPFEFRPLNGQEAITYGGKNQQEAITAKAVENISKQRIVKTAPLALAALEAEKRRTANGESVTHLEHHLRQYTRRNTSDFFIHKDLKGFLARELDFYLKNEVLNLEEMEAAGDGLSEGWFQTMRLIKKVGGHIIEFLAQIEAFQKMLWEKRKFITETFYCITVGHIPEAFYPEIAACEAQWEEWKALFSVDEGKSGKGRKDRRIELLKAHPTLVLDTRHFSPDFTDRLLASYDDLDEATDGLLVHSENWQALNLLTEKYREQVKCVYIDPPYNAQSSEILYKNNYKHSSWLSLIQDRILCSTPALSEPFVYIIAIDEVENMKLGLMLSETFPNCEDATVSIVHNPTGQQGNNFSFTHDFAHFLYPQNVNCIGLENRDDPSRESEPDIRPLRNVSSGVNHLRQSAANCFYPIYVKDGNILGFGDVCEDDFHPGSMNVNRRGGIIEVYPIDPSNTESKWVFARDTVESIKNELYAEYDKKKKSWDIIRKKNRFRYKSLWEDKRGSFSN